MYSRSGVNLVTVTHGFISVFCSCETWSCALREGCKLQKFKYNWLPGGGGGEEEEKQAKYWCGNLSASGCLEGRGVGKINIKMNLGKIGC
jgi:hypothetical protein